ncbi:MAG: cyclase family protein [Syntrophaceae bacterium]|nr:cyclase family protein [Syntrophaceae bacterium]
MATIFDLSIPLEDSPSEPQPVKVEHKSHESSLPLVELVFGAKKEDIADGLGWADDSISLSAHSGTHVDAPWHYAPISENKRARTIDTMPLDWFFHDGVVLDFRHKPRGYGISVDDIKDALTKIKYTIKPWDIVLIQTGADKLWGKPEYFTAGCGMTEESTLWLIEQGCRVVGIDAWGWDRPFDVIREEFARTNNKKVIWTAHKAGIKKEYCHIEKLANLDTLPRPLGFKVACFPVKLTGGSAGWARVVAIYQD